ncbi:MAG: monovalent cation/H(+) antiporter subunit G [Rhodospirillaceae bacterium]|nr:monovalent cation/H(+) antiporter subunit G [Rhodospirillaceae bacterium]
MDAVRDIASWVLLAGGAVFGLISGAGMLRLPDFYTRLHAASLSDSAAAALIAAGLMVQAPSGLVAVKLLLILAFLFFTSPAATHALARAAWGDGLRPWLPRDADGGPPSTP